LARKGDNDQAIAEYDQAIELNPTDGDSFRVRGDVYDDKHEYDRAIADYDHAIELNPKDANAYFERGGTYEHKGEFDHAIADLDHAIALRPDYFRAYFSRAVAYHRKGDDDRALADFDKVIELAPDEADPHLIRGALYEFKGEYDKALADYDRVIALDPNSTDAKSRRAATIAKRDAANKAVASAQPQSSTVVVDHSATPVPPVPETRIALVIGNSNYTAVGKLPNPPRDAAALADALRADGFSEVKLVSDVTRKELVKALNDFQDESAKADWAVIYFAGHGIELDGMNYLIPVDAVLKTDRDLQDEAVSLERVISSVANAKKLRLVILDACRNNPFASSMHMTVASRAIHRGLARIEPSGGTLIAYAAKDGEEAIDGDSSGNSPFAAALIKYLVRPGLEVGRLFRLVRDDVLAATDRQQEPFVYGSLPGEELFFRPQ
jgi:tetratricopeptide (TPR) repeat protein